MKRYRLQRRLIGPVYNANNVKQYEQALDAVLTRVIDQLHSLNGATVDLKEWMHITVVECLGAVSLSTWSPGYLAAKSDGATGKHAYMGWRRKSVFGLFPLAVILETSSRTFGRAFANFWGLTYHTPKEGFRPFFPVSLYFPRKHPSKLTLLSGRSKESQPACPSRAARTYATGKRTRRAEEYRGRLDPTE